MYLYRFFFTLAHFLGQISTCYIISTCSVNSNISTRIRLSEIMAEDLSYNLKATGEKFIWDGTLDNLKKFVSDELKLLGKWTSPGGETKLFTSGSVSLKWQSKTSKWITVYGSPNEVNDVTEQLKSSCEVATTDPINVDECGVDSLNNGDHAEANIDEPTDDEIATGMLNETNLTIPISSSTECKFIKDKLSNIEAEVKFLEAKFLDKTLNLTNDLNNLKKYCLDNSTEYVNSLRHENASLKDENRALKDSLEISKFALSDLNTKVKELENEKACLTTSLKILYQDFNQSPEHCFNKQEAAASTDNCSCVKSSLASAESHTSQNNETILIPDDETKPSKKSIKPESLLKKRKPLRTPTLTKVETLNRLSEHQQKMVIRAIIVGHTGKKLPLLLATQL